MIQTVSIHGLQFGNFFKRGNGFHVLPQTRMCQPHAVPGAVLIGVAADGFTKRRNGLFKPTSTFTNKSQVEPGRRILWSQGNSLLKPSFSGLKMLTLGIDRRQMQGGLHVCGVLGNRARKFAISFIFLAEELPQPASRIMPPMFKFH